MEEAQQQDCGSSGAVAAAAAAAAPSWGTLEELLLVGAISRHGAGDWNVVAAELQARSKLLAVPAAYFSPEACKGRFDALSGKYGHVSSKEVDNHLPWFDEIRKRRVAQLKREVEKHDGSILILTQKLKRLKSERTQLPPNSHRPGKEAFKPSQPEKDVETSKVVDMETQAACSSVEEPTPPPDGPHTASEPAEAVQSIKDKHVVGEENAGDGETQASGAPVLDKNREEKAAEEAAKDESMDEKEKSVVEQGGEDRAIAQKQPEELKLLSSSGTEAGKEEGQTPQEFTMNVDEASIHEAAASKARSEESFEQQDSRLTEHRQEDTQVEADRSTARNEEKAMEGVEAIPPIEQPNSRETPDQDQSEGAELHSDEVPMPLGLLQGSPQEKEGSSNGSSLETSKQAEEKSDESQVAARVYPDEKVVSRQDETGSPASANQNQEQSKDGASQVEKSEVGSQVEGLGDDTSPTSRRLKRCEKLPAKMQSLGEWLKTLYNHKFAAMFRQRQGSQENPRYEQVIKRHVDLNMIKSRLEDGAYSSNMEFFRDVLLLFSNALVYYPKDSPENSAALLLRKLTMDEMDRVMRSEEGTKPSTTKKRAKGGSAGTPTAAITSLPVFPAPMLVTTSTPPAPVATVSTTPAATTSAQGEVSFSDNSKSKSASVSLGVRSSKGGDEGEGGEPEVSGKSKPLKAYGRKNRSKAVKESPLDAIVKKEMAAAAAAAAKEKEKERDSAATAAPPTAAAPTAATTTTSKGKGKDKEKAKEKAEGGKKSKGAAAAAAAVAVIPSSPPIAPSVALVRGARNKRTKDSSQKSGSTGKRRRM